MQTSLGHSSSVLNKEVSVRAYILYIEAYVHAYILSAL